MQISFKVFALDILSQFPHQQHPLVFSLLNVEVLKRGKGEFLRCDGARFVSEEAVRRFLSIASFRTEDTEVSVFRFCDVAF